MNLRAVEKERELKRQRTSKACGKQSSCCSDRLQSANYTSTEEKGNRNQGNEEDLVYQFVVLLLTVFRISHWIVAMDTFLQ